MYQNLNTMGFIVNDNERNTMNTLDLKFETWFSNFDAYNWLLSSSTLVQKNLHQSFTINSPKDYL